MSFKTKNRIGKNGRQSPSRARRNVLLGGLGGVGLASLPDTWMHPVVQSVTLPAHAQTSPSGSAFTTTIQFP